MRVATLPPGVISPAAKRPRVATRERTRTIGDGEITWGVSVPLTIERLMQAAVSQAMRRWCMAIAGSEPLEADNRHHKEDSAPDRHLHHIGRIPGVDVQHIRRDDFHPLA